MRVAVDIRSMQSGRLSGVENYILNLLESVLDIDKVNNYLFFSNAFRKKPAKTLQYINSETISTRIPNKILNLGLSGISRPKLDSLIGGADIFFLPNLNPCSVSENTKLVVTVHDLSPVECPEFYDLKRRIWHRILNFKRILKRADLVLAVSEHTKQDLLSTIDIPSERVKVLYPGVTEPSVDNLRLERLREVRNKYHLPGEFILFLSTIEPRKNLLGLIKAFERLSFGAHLVIAGSLGWRYSNVVQLSLASPKRHMIHFIGEVAEHDKAALLKLAKVVAYPSFYEGFGFVPLEAMSVGTPVLTSNVTSLPEVAGEASLMVDPYQIDDIAMGLMRLLTEEALRLKLVQAGSLWYKRYNWHRSARELLSYFNELKN